MEGLGFLDHRVMATVFKHSQPGPMAPSTTTAPLGQTLVAINRGGEVHTFTHVEAFGDGLVPLLNDLAHVPNVAPECLQLEPDDFVAPGTTYEETVENTGTQR